jgi:hypothetical protein
MGGSNQGQFREELCNLPGWTEKDHTKPLNSGSSTWNWNLSPPEYKSDAILLELRCSVCLV